jgi:putative transposase
MMVYDPEKHHRRTIRAAGYDYSAPGAYFVTVCVRDKKCVLGEVVNDVMRLNAWGRIVNDCWRAIPEHFPHAQGDYWVVMPNHVHGIIVISLEQNVGARHAVPLPSHMEQFGKPVPGSIPTMVRSFKSAVSKRINELRGHTGSVFWQRNYHERIIRDEAEWNCIREYIETNPARWAEDRENPNGKT